MSNEISNRLAEFKRTKSITTAVEICELLLEEEDGKEDKVYD